MKGFVLRIVLGAVLGGAAVIPVVLFLVNALAADKTLAFLIGLTFGYIGSNVGIVVTTLWWKSA